jgi:hypothetical protein
MSFHCRRIDGGGSTSGLEKTLQSPVDRNASGVGPASPRFNPFLVSGACLVRREADGFKESIFQGLNLSA